MQAKRLLLPVLAGLAVLGGAVWAIRELHEEAVEQSREAASKVPRLDLAELTPAWLVHHVELPPEAVPSPQTAEPSPDPRSRRIAAWLLGRPPIAGLPVKFCGHRQALANYRKGVIQFREFPPIPWRAPVDWTEGPSWTFLAELHSWRYLTPVINEYARTGDPQLLKDVVDIVLDWSRSNPPPEGAHRRAWHDGSVVKRTGVLLILLNAYRQQGASPRLPVQALMALIHQHARAVASPERYMGLGNHGLRQDMSLYFVATGVPEFKASPGWRRLAEERLRRQIREGFTAEGVWREHSPGYHVYVMLRLHDLTRFMQALGIDEPEWLRQHVLRSQHYLAHVMTPEGNLPPVGDTNLKPLPDAYPIRLPALRYTVTGGREGRPPSERVGFFPGAGEVTFRRTWGPTPADVRDSLYLHLHADSPGRFGHRHEDALSFILYAHGNWWVIDPGKYRPRKDAFREYVVGQWAHNTYVLNEKPVHPRVPLDKGVGIEGEPVVRDDLLAVAAFSGRFSSPAQATRVLAYLPGEDTLVVLDVLRAEPGDRWTGHFHVAPELKTEVRGHCVTASADDRAWMLDVADSRQENDRLEIVRGREDPLLGWAYRRGRGRRPLSTLQYRRSGHRREVATVFRWRRPDAGPTEGMSVLRQGNGYLVRWHADGQKHEIRFDLADGLRVTQREAGLTNPGPSVP